MKRLLTLILFTLLLIPGISYGYKQEEPVFSGKPLTDINIENYIFECIGGYVYISNSNEDGTISYFEILDSSDEHMTCRNLCGANSTFTCEGL